MARRVLSRYQLRTAAIALLAITSASSFAADPTFIVGKTGNVIIANVQNNSESAGAMQNVAVSIIASPEFISAAPTVQPQSAASISVGGEQSFQIQFSVNPGIDSVVGVLTYRVTVDNPNSYPKTKDFSVELQVDGQAPGVTISDSKGAVQPGGASSGQGISIIADDRRVGGGGDPPIVSGLAKLEIWKGDPASGGQLLASNEAVFAEMHNYTSADTGLSVLAQLPEGEIFVRAIDGAGNETSVHISAVSV